MKLIQCKHILTGLFVSHPFISTDSLFENAWFSRRVSAVHLPLAAMNFTFQLSAS